LSRFAGGVKADSGYIVNSFPDTLTANYGFLKNISGLMIRVQDTLYVRAECLCKWNTVGYLVDWGVDSPLLVSGNTLSIDTTSTKGVATQYDLTQISGGGGGVSSVVARGDTLRYFIGGDSTYIGNMGTTPDLQGAINNGATLTNDVTVNSTGHNFTVDSLLNFYIYAKDYDGDGNGNINLESSSQDNTLLSVLNINSAFAGISSNSSATGETGAVITSAQNITISVSSALKSASLEIYKDSVVLESDTLKLRINGYGNGKVLTSDTYGTATWQTPTSAGDTTQIHTSGSTVNVGDSTTWLIVNPASTLTSLTVNLPQGVNHKCLKISFGGTISSPASSVVGTLTIVPYSGDAVNGTTVYYSMETDNCIILKFNQSNNTWYK
jgi:hypothetical protein